MFNFLKKVDLFSQMADADLFQLCDTVEKLTLEAGAQLFAQGSPGNRAFVIQEGQLEIIRDDRGRQVLLAVRGPGEVIGEMALLQEAPRMASVQARTQAHLIAIDKEQLDNLLHSSGSAALAMLQTVLARWRSDQTLLQQSQRMAQLGTLTAGVAHELNNPAGAVARGADQLQTVLKRFGSAHAQLSSLVLTPGKSRYLEQLDGDVQRKATQPVLIDALTRSDQEAELEMWLEEQGIENSWEIAPTLVDLELDLAGCSALSSFFSPAELPVILAWMAATHGAYNLLAEIGQGAARISAIVKALKSYSYLDQAPVQSVDVNQGLDDTLLILRSKLKAVTVRREYDKELPPIVAYGSELNQVWTNLLDNAGDALAEAAGDQEPSSGEIRVRTRSHGRWICVEITDNGPGIPPENQDRIFDTFFTTKPPGKGTGLGLDISYNIIVHKHRGDIRVTSRPGMTTFQIWLPVNFEEVNEPPPLLQEPPA